MLGCHEACPVCCCRRHLQFLIGAQHLAPHMRLLPLTCGPCRLLWSSPLGAHTHPSREPSSCVCKYAPSVLSEAVGNQVICAVEVLVLSVAAAGVNSCPSSQACSTNATRLGRKQDFVYTPSGQQFPTASSGINPFHDPLQVWKMY
jgi:hypothetical protein